MYNCTCPNQVSPTHCRWFYILPIADTSHILPVREKYILAYLFQEFQYKQSCILILLIQLFCYLNIQTFIGTFMHWQKGLGLKGEAVQSLAGIMNIFFSWRALHAFNTLIYTSRLQLIQLWLCQWKKAFLPCHHWPEN